MNAYDGKQTYSRAEVELESEFFDSNSTPTTFKLQQHRFIHEIEIRVWLLVKLRL